MRLNEHLSNFPRPLKRALAALERDGLSGSALVRQVAAIEANVKTRLDRPNHKLRPAEVQTLVEAYQAGANVMKLSRRFNLHEQTVRAHLRRAGVEIRPQRVLTETQVVEIVELYRAGVPMKPLARQYGVAYNSIRNYLLRAGVELRPARRTPSQAASRPLVT